MDYTRVTSTPSIRVHDHNGNNHGRRRSTSRSAGASIPRSPAPMAIPNSRPDLPPPPLPPPRNIGDIAAGNDPGWAWGNDPSGGFGKSGGSTMTGANFPKSWSSRPEEKRHNERPERPEYRRRESSSTTIKSPPSTDRRHDSNRQQDEGYYSVSGPRPSAMTQQSVYTLSHRRTRSSSYTMFRDESTSRLLAQPINDLRKAFVPRRVTNSCVCVDYMVRDIYNNGI